MWVHDLRDEFNETMLETLATDIKANCEFWLKLNSFFKIAIIKVG
jgi:hypothetical protein